MPDGHQVSRSDGLRALPLFNPDLADERIEAVERWRTTITGSDALLIASPEYGHSLPGALKNGIDWLIGTGELEGMRMAITASTPGPERGLKGLSALRQTLGAVSAQLVWDAPIVRGEQSDAELRALLERLVDPAPQ